MIKYAHRTLAVIYLVFWFAFSTSWIGEPSSGKPITWLSAWSFFSVIAVAAWLGWQASKEATHNNQQTEGT